MSLVLIGKDLLLEAKQRTNGFQAVTKYPEPLSMDCGEAHFFFPRVAREKQAGFAGVSTARVPLMPRRRMGRLEIYQLGGCWYQSYCWWTTKDDDYPILYRVLIIPGVAWFCPSTVWLEILLMEHILRKHQLRWKVVHPIIYHCFVVSLQLVAGFLPSTVPLVGCCFIPLNWCFPLQLYLVLVFRFSLRP